MNEPLCQDPARREAVRLDRRLYGLDYLEVGEDQLTLTVYFLGKAPRGLEARNLRIDGGERITGIDVIAMRLERFRDPELDDYMVVTLDRFGDFSTYTLRVVAQDEGGDWGPHPDFDPRFDRLAFSFKVDCPTGLDCRTDQICPPEERETPEINYLAKDYESFRRLILDRLALVMPEWRERHVPDIGIALVELLAYTGDYLSYYQDAVATEAYLDTARQRISVRRHARLVDYRLHEGCNARAWVSIETDSDFSLSADTFYFITRPAQAPQTLGPVVSSEELRPIAGHLYELFEALRPRALQLYRDHSRISFYSWGDAECCLPKGATRATLLGQLVRHQQPPAEAYGPPAGGDPAPDAPPDVPVTAAHHVERAPSAMTAPQLHLKAGDILIFQEMMGPRTGHPGDADPHHRHAVRLASVAAGCDPLTGLAVVEIAWDEEDALPFALCMSAVGPAPACELLEDVSIALGNVVLVDHGAGRDEPLGEVPAGEIRDCCRDVGLPADEQLIPGTYRPMLGGAPLTFSQPLDHAAPAARLLSQDPRKALPLVKLKGEPAFSGDPWWQARADLLSSGPDDPHFVAEMDEAGRAHLRFGDDACGEQPDVGTAFTAFYRVGNGLAGNVGAEAIVHLVLRDATLDGVTLKVRNPLPARGGTAPEPINEAKRFAPHAFRTELQRAITADDYAAIVVRDFGRRIQRAAARLRWTGSWYEVLVAIDPLGSDTAAPELLAEIEAHLHRYRRMGHDLVVAAAQRVPLEVELLV
ncbi:putative baseplate assembly protein [Desulfatitalea tepidiphila]|uniref:putative baseplate assembly protein n=1 Tax=Desulfatitalea tepidiphila TaxID=1185843 RepID=UPI000A493A5F|nr:putative baseplate assembly protein [Desulfatitalea tepidiphila]